MPVTDREFQSLKELIETNHEHIVNTLELRKNYFDVKFKELCSAVKDMKAHCIHVQDNCSVVFKEFDRRIDENTTDITKIKTIGSVVAVIWGGCIAAVSHIIEKASRG